MSAILPESWAEVEHRLGLLLADEVEAVEWMRQATMAAWGAPSRRHLPVVARALALQRLSSALMILEAGTVDLAFTVGKRGVVAAAFAQVFGTVLDGPPWRLDPFEESRPAYSEWVGQSDFDSPPTERPADERP